MGLDTPTVAAPPPPSGAPRTPSDQTESPGGQAAAEVRAVKLPLVDRVASAVVTGAPPILVIGTHWAAPTAGHVRRDGAAFRFEVKAHADA